MKANDLSFHIPEMPTFSSQFLLYEQYCYPKSIGIQQETDRSTGASLIPNDRATSRFILVPWLTPYW